MKTNVNETAPHISVTGTVWRVQCTIYTVPAVSNSRYVNSGHLSCRNTVTRHRGVIQVSNIVSGYDIRSVYRNFIRNRRGCNNNYNVTVLCVRLYGRE